MTARAVRRRAAWGSFAVATVLAVAGCSGIGDATSPATTATPTPEPSVSAPTAQSASPTESASSTESAASSPSASDTTSAADPSATLAPEQNLASRDFKVTGTYDKSRLRMRFGVVELKRRGDLLDLRATLTNLEPDGSRDLRWQVASRFQGSYRQDITSTDGAFSGAVLTDMVGKKRYLVAADSGNTCVCTVQLSSTFVGAGQSIELNATYAAPPATTTKLDVTVTSIGTFRDLPVS